MSSFKTITVGGGDVKEVAFGTHLPFGLMAGSNTIEDRDSTLRIAEHLVNLCDRLNIPFVYKSSYDKANRSSITSKRGMGLEAGVKILAEVRQQFGCPVITDVHEPWQAEPVAEVADILQLPAFLCRQTDLVLALAKTGKPINVKKAQFIAPHDVGNICKKIESANNHNILLCERGNMYGYNDQIVDMRSFPVMEQTGYPVIFDATHAVQRPTGQGTHTGGHREFVEPYARAIAAMGVAGFFMECHPDPANAHCEQQTQLPLEVMEPLLQRLLVLDQHAKAWTAEGPVYKGA